ncbi:MAG: 3-deoxy-D-manno-octulosonic acid transferase [Bacteroidetes bacterium]|nr:MAG: 3-deoxy-D-manno-octulosonic acid transferase [Bacteroidota bacterium]MBL1145590.1 3-deoxy-D-manno-octulosonic acid transferase [Bacteroidota bacterium]NOG58386.1 3-deoxy-D-manno-octulosonic acid transferase [Bacteroidota bacterium]
MRIVYSFSILVYSKLILLFSLFNEKAKKWIIGRKDVFDKLAKINPEKRKVVWIHSASLGEFEQAIPIIEKLKKETDFYILATFFSPSGYENRKNYPLADFICYLPIDTVRNAKKFLDLAKPDLAIFIKYEFWFNYLNQIKIKQIPCFLVAGIFRKNQLFFHPLGSWFKNQLKAFNYFFVQNNSSKALLEKIGFSNLEIAGDTRFDRVLEIAKQPYHNELIESFTSNEKVVVIGSSWAKENRFVEKYLKEKPNNKFIIAPHEIKPNEIELLKNTLGKNAILWSEVDALSKIEHYQILIIDKIGLLSKLYRFAYLSVIGGGFGSGIHNTLEAAAYGSPIIFGPNYQKFQEAKDLVQLEAAFSFANYNEFKSLIDRFLNDNYFQQKAGSAAKNYVIGNSGSAEKIIEKINNTLIY